MQRPPDHDERVAAARRVAEWNLGDGDWGSVIVGVYFDPSTASVWLDEEE